MLKKLLPIAISFFALSLNVFSQSYNISITNGVFIDDNTYEFDVAIVSIEQEFELTSYQVSLAQDIAENNELTFSYVSGTSELNNVPSTSIGTMTNSNGNGLLTFASLPGEDTIGISEKRIGRFSLISNKTLKKIKPFICWNFDGEFPTIITGLGFKDITSSGDFLPKDETSVASDEEKTGIVEEFELMQNYPNPFNPSTIIKYKIAAESTVQLKVFNLLGEEVKTLVDEVLSAGVYEAKFDASSLASGYYIYSLYVDNRILATKKMILLK
jgi:hypothetical protein